MAETIVAFVFPGQGSQKVGMLAEAHERFQAVRDTFEEASQALGYDMWDLIQNGEQDALNLTETTQPVLLSASVALWRAWKEAAGRDPAVMAEIKRGGGEGRGGTYHGGGDVVPSHTRAVCPLHSPPLSLSPSLSLPLSVPPLPSRPSSLTFFRSALSYPFFWFFICFSSLSLSLSFVNYKYLYIVFCS